MTARGYGNVRSRSRGFTLIEMMVVIAIIGLLAGLIMAGLNVARRQSANVKARDGVEQLETAWNAYYVDYGSFPTIAADSVSPGGGTHYETGRAVIQILRGRENHNGQNAKKISYMDFNLNATEFRDPWGNRYRIALDTDYDGKVTAMSENLRLSVAVWSAGADGTDDTDDDVTSWRKQ